MSDSWFVDGIEIDLSFVQAALDSFDTPTRERAYHAIEKAERICRPKATHLVACYGLLTKQVIDGFEVDLLLGVPKTLILTITTTTLPDGTYDLWAPVVFDPVSGKISEVVSTPGFGKLRRGLKSVARLRLLEARFLSEDATGLRHYAVEADDRPGQLARSYVFEAVVPIKLIGGSGAKRRRPSTRVLLSALAVLAQAGFGLRSPLDRRRGASLPETDVALYASLLPVISMLAAALKIVALGRFDEHVGLIELDRSASGKGASSRRTHRRELGDSP